MILHLSRAALAASASVLIATAVVAGGTEAKSGAKSKTKPNPPPSAAAQGPGDPGAVQSGAIPPSVEKGELAPVMAADGSGLPFELWQGLDVARIEGLMKDIQIPPRSPALHNLWTRLITSDAAPGVGQQPATQFAALRIEALYRSGLARDAAAELDTLPADKLPADSRPLFAMLRARNALATGDEVKVCAAAKQAAGAVQQIPEILKAQAVLIAGYCAVAANDAASAGLTADLAREAGLKPSAGLEALDAFAAGRKPGPTKAKSISLIDQKIVARAGGAPASDLLSKAEPALLVSIALDPKANPTDRIAAAEAAASLNAIEPADLANGYNFLAQSQVAETLLSGEPQSSPQRRANLLKAISAEQTPIKKTRLMRALLDDGKRAGLYFQTLQILAPLSSPLSAQPELSWFAETAIEIGIAAGDLEMARRWIKLAAAPGLANSSLDHWLALADIADPQLAGRGKDMAALESLAVTGKFSPGALHRLATVLDALNYQVPIPLWNAASRTPQPNDGFLPATGVLSELQDASHKREFGRTVLLVMQALGSNGAAAAHIIALGDSIRALRRAGLEPDARKLGVEALLAEWPRTATN